MSQNVAQVVEGRASTMFEKLAQNVDLANVVMGFLGRIIIMCQQRGRPIQGVDATPVVVSKDEFRFGISFNDLVITPMGIWQPQGDLMSYAKSRSAHLAKALERNNKLIRTFTDLVERVEKYCERNRIPFRDFKIKKAYNHPKTDTCVIRAGVTTLGDRFR